MNAYYLSSVVNVEAFEAAADRINLPTKNTREPSHEAKNTSHSQRADTV